MRCLVRGGYVLCAVCTVLRCERSDGRRCCAVVDKVKVLSSYLHEGHQGRSPTGQIGLFVGVRVLPPEMVKGMEMNSASMRAVGTAGFFVGVCVLPPGMVKGRLTNSSLMRPGGITLTVDGGL